MSPRGITLEVLPSFGLGLTEWEMYPERYAPRPPAENPAVSPSRQASASAPATDEINPTNLPSKSNGEGE